MSLCTFANGRCESCGYETRFPDLIRECHTPVVQSSEYAVFPPPTLADLYRLQGNATEVPLATLMPPSFFGGPGTELKKLLAGWPFYITATADCPCNEMASLMDGWGADECELRIGEIVAHLRTQADQRGLPFFDAVGMVLVKTAIRRARRHAHRHPSSP